MGIGEMIKEYLKEKGITQVFLSKRAGIENSKLNYALNGSRRLSLEEYAAICGALGVNTDYFLKPQIPCNPPIHRSAV